MKIGDEVYVHGYIDEIRKDTIIIRNEGGYFGTVKEEISVNPLEEELEKIKAEIGEIEETDHDFEGFYYCQNEVLKIIEKSISELKGENK